MGSRGRRSAVPQSLDIRHDPAARFPSEIGQVPGVASARDPVQRSARFAVVIVLGLVVLASCGFGVTQPAADVTDVSARLTGSVHNTIVGPTEYWFEYGTTTAYGSSTPHRSVNVADTAKGYAVQEVVLALREATTYHDRLCARDADGKGACGGDQTFTTTTGRDSVTGTGTVFSIPNVGFTIGGAFSVTSSPNGANAGGHAATGPGSFYFKVSDSGPVTCLRVVGHRATIGFVAEPPGIGEPPDTPPIPKLVFIEDNGPTGDRFGLRSVSDAHSCPAATRRGLPELRRRRVPGPAGRDLGRLRGPRPHHLVAREPCAEISCAEPLTHEHTFGYGVITFPTLPPSVSAWRARSVGACRVRGASEVDRVAAGVVASARPGGARRRPGQGAGRGDRGAEAAGRCGGDAGGGAGGARPVRGRTDGPFRDAGAWMAHVAGTTVGRAKATIETAQRLTALPATSAALRAGSLSEVQVDAIAAAATADPRAERALLQSAATDGVRGLKNACARVEAAASTDQAERYEKARVRPVPAARRDLGRGGAARAARPDRCDRAGDGGVAADRGGAVRSGARARGRRVGSRRRRWRSTRWSRWRTNRRQVASVVERAAGAGDDRGAGRSRRVHRAATPRRARSARSSGSGRSRSSVVAEARRVTWSSRR